MPEYDWSPLVEELADMGDAAARLLEEHRDDGTGRCRLCGSHQAAKRRWPCTLRELAVLALTRQAERQLDSADGALRRPASRVAPIHRGRR